MIELLHPTAAAGLAAGAGLAEPKAFAQLAMPTTIDAKSTGEGLEGPQPTGNAKGAGTRASQHRLSGEGPVTLCDTFQTIPNPGGNACTVSVTGARA